MEKNANIKKDAVLCYINIKNLTDIEFDYESEEDISMIKQTIEATIEGVLKREMDKILDGLKAVSKHTERLNTANLAHSKPAIKGHVSSIIEYINNNYTN